MIPSQVKAINAPGDVVLVDDVSAVAQAIQAASSVDVVVLDRVVCCYPDWRALLESAGTHARTAIVMSYPLESWYTRVWVKSANIAMRTLRKTFRLHLHSPSAMQKLLQNCGFTNKVHSFKFFAAQKQFQSL